jgi:hypothetical protein
MVGGTGVVLQLLLSPAVTTAYLALNVLTLQHGGGQWRVRAGGHVGAVTAAYLQLASTARSPCSMVGGTGVVLQLLLSPAVTTAYLALNVLTLQHGGGHWRVRVGGHVGAVRCQVGRPNDVEQARRVHLGSQAARQAGKSSSKQPAASSFCGQEADV